MNWISRVHGLLRRFSDRENVSKKQQADDFVQLFVDRLEERRVLNVSAALADGVLSITGDGEADDVVVELINAGEDNSGPTEEFIQILVNGSQIDIDTMGAGPVSRIATSQLHGNGGTTAGLKIDLGGGSDTLDLQVPTGASFVSQELSIDVDDDEGQMSAGDDIVTLRDNGLAPAATNVSLDIEADSIRFANSGSMNDQHFQLGVADVSLTGDLQFAGDLMVTLDGDLSIEGDLLNDFATSGLNRNLTFNLPDLDMSMDSNEFSLDGDVGADMQRFGDLNVNAPLITLGGSVFTTGTQAWNGDLTLSANADLDAGGNVNIGEVAGAGFAFEIESGDSVSLLGNADGLDSLSITASNNISLIDVTTAGDQLYEATKLTTNSDYITGGGNFEVIGDWDLLSSASVTTSGGEIDLSAAVVFTSMPSGGPGMNPAVNLTLSSTGSTDGEIKLGATKQMPMELLDDVVITDAGDVTFADEPFQLKGNLQQQSGTGTTTLDGTIEVASVDIVTNHLNVADGTTVASQGAISLQLEGDASVAGTLDNSTAMPSANVTITADTLNLGGEIKSSGDIDLTSLSAPIEISGEAELVAGAGTGMITVMGNITGDGNPGSMVTFNGTTTVTGGIAGVDGDIVSGATGKDLAQVTVLNGKLTSDGIDVAGDLIVGPGGSVETTGPNVRVFGTTTLSGDLSATAAGNVFLKDVEVNGLRTLTANSINVDGDLVAGAGMGMPTVRLAGGTTVTGSIGTGMDGLNLTLLLGDLEAGSINLGGDLIVGAGTNASTTAGQVRVVGQTQLGGNLTAFMGQDLTLLNGVGLTGSATLTGENINITGDIIAGAGSGMPDVKLVGTSMVSGNIGGANMMGDNVGSLTIENGKLTTGGIDIADDLIVKANLNDATDQGVETLDEGITVDGDLVADAVINSAAAVDIAGVSSLGAGITSAGLQSFGDTITLTSDVTLTANGGMTGFDLAAIDGDGNALTLTSAGITTLGGNVSNVTDFVIDGSGTTQLNSASITASNRISIEEALRIDQDATISALDEVSITGPIESEMGELNALNITSAGGAATSNLGGQILLGSDIGANNAFGSVTFQAADLISLHDVTSQRGMAGGPTGNQSYTATKIITNSSYVTGGGDFTMSGVWDVRSSSMVTTSGGNIDLSAATLTSSNMGVTLQLDGTNGMSPGGTVLLGEADDSEGFTLNHLDVDAQDVSFTNGAPFEVGSIDVVSATGIGLRSVTTTGDQTYQANGIEIEGTFLTNGGAFTLTGNMMPVNVVLVDSIDVTTTTPMPANNSAASGIDLSNAILSATDVGQSVSFGAGPLADVAVLGADSVEGGEFVDSLTIVSANEITLGGNDLTFTNALDVQAATTVFLTGALLAGTINVTGNVEASSSMESTTGNIAIDGNLQSDSQVTSAADLSVTGTGEFAGDLVSTGTIDIDGTVTLTGDVTFEASSIELGTDLIGDGLLQHQANFRGNTQVDGSIGGAGRTLGSIISESGTLTAGDIQISGDLSGTETIMTTIGVIDVSGNGDFGGDTSSATSLTVGGRVDTAGDLTAMNGNLSLGAASMERVLLQGDVLFTASDSIDFGGDLLSDMSGPHSATFSAMNGTTVAGQVGTAPQALQDLNIQLGTFSAGGIHLAGDLIAADSVETTAGGNIHVGGNLDTASTLSSDGFLTVVGTAELGGDVTTQADQVYQSAVTVTDDVTFMAADGVDMDSNAIRFDSTLAADVAAIFSNLTFDVTGDILFGDAVGLIDSLTIDAVSNALFNSTVDVMNNLAISSASDVQFDAAIQIGGDFEQTAGTGTTTFNGTFGTGIGGVLNVTTNHVVFDSAQIVSADQVGIAANDSITFENGGSLDASAADISFTADADDMNGGQFSQENGSIIQTDGNINILVQGMGDALISDVRAEASSGLIEITAGGAIIDNRLGEGANLTGFSAALIATSGIGDADDIDTMLSQIAFENTSNTAQTQIENTGSLTIAETGSLTESRSNAGGSVIALSPLTISMPTFVGGNMTFTAGDSMSDDDDLTIAADVTHTTGDGFIAFVAGDDVLQTMGTITNTGGTVNEVRFLADHEGAMGGDTDRGEITQSAGAGIIAGRASFVSFDRVVLDQSTTNSISTVAATISGPNAAFSLANTTDLSIGIVPSGNATPSTPDDVNGITTNDGDVNIDNGNSHLTIGTGSGEDISAGSGTVIINASGVSEQSGSTIAAEALDLSGTGTFTLDEDNSIFTFAANVDGALTLKNINDLSVDTITNAGVTTTDNDVSLEIAGHLTIGDVTDVAVDAGTANVSIDAAGMTQSAASAIISSGLELLGDGNFQLEGLNQVDELAGDLMGTLTFNNTRTSLLTIGEVGSTTGLTIASPPMMLNTLTTAGAIFLDEQLSAAGTNVSVTSNGSVTQDAEGIITANVLGVLQNDAASTPIDIDLCEDNLVNIFSAGNMSTAGAIRFHNATDLAIGGGGTPTGVETNNGAIQVTVDGQLSVNDLIDSTAMTADTDDGDILLSATGSVQINAAVNSGFAAMTDTGDLFITSGDAVSLDGTVTADVLRIVANGNITQTEEFTVQTLGVRQESTTAGSILLDETNSFSTVAAENLFDGGLVSLVSDQATTVGTVAGTAAVGKAPAFAMTAGVLSTNGTITLEVFGASLEIGTGAGEDVSAANANAILHGDGISQAMNSTITADQLNLSGTGNVTLDQGNNVNLLAAEVDGSLLFNDLDTLTVGSFVNDGINTMGNDVSLTTGDRLTIAMDQSITATGATVAINTTTGGIDQQANANILAANLQVLGTGLVFNLSGPNEIDVLAADVDGIFSFTNAQSLVVSTVMSSLGTTSGVTTAGDTLAITTTGPGSTLQVGTGAMGEGLSSDGGTITLTSSDSLSLRNTVDATTAGLVQLIGEGTIDQTGTAIITANQLQVLQENNTAGDVDLCADNIVSTLAAENDALGGAILFHSESSLTIDRINPDISADGVQSNFGLIQVTSADSLTIDRSVLTNHLGGTGNADIYLGSGDTLMVNAAITATFTAMTDTGDLFLDSATDVFINDTLTADVIRIVSRGDIQQSGTGVITANELATRQESMTTGAITLDADNQVAVFAADNAFTNGTVSFTNNQALSIGTVSALLAIGKAPAFTATSGITTDAGDVSVVVNNDSLTIGEMSGGEDINAGAGSVSLNAAGVAEQANSIVTAADLELLGTGTFTLSQSNQVGILAANVNGDLTFENAQTLTTGTAGSTSGITTSDDAVQLTTTGAGSELRIGNGAMNEGISTGNGDLTINSADAVTIGDGAGQTIDAGTGKIVIQAGANGVAESAGSTVSAAQLELLGTGDFTLDEDNEIGILAAEIDGALSFNDLDALEIGTVNATNGLSSAGGNVSVTSGGILTVNNEVNTEDGMMGTGGVVQINSINLNAALVAGPGDITLNGGGDDLIITADQSTATSALYSARRDVIIGATIETKTATADLTISADTDDDGSGGVQIQTAGQLNSGKDVLVEGSDLFASASTVDGVVIDNDGATEQILAVGDVTLQMRSMAPANSDIVLDGVIRSTTGSINTSANQNILLATTVDATAADVNFQSNVILTDHSVVNAGGSITFAVTVDSEANEANTLSLTAGTQVQFAGAVGATMNGSLGGLTIDDATDIDFDGTVELAGNLDIDTGMSGTVDFADSVTTTNGGTVEITNDGQLTIVNSAVFNLDGSFTQDGSGDVVTGADLTTTADAISFNAPATITDDVALSTGGGMMDAGDITFLDDVSGAFDLMLTAGMGSIAFSTIGTAAALTKLTITSANNVTFNGNVQTAQNGDVSITHKGLLTLDNSAVFTLGGSFSEDGSGTVTTGADITTTADDVLFNSAVTLSDSISIDSTGGNIEFRSTLDGTTDFAEDLMLTTGAGDIQFNMSVGATTDLGAITIASAQNVTFDALANSESITQTTGTGTTTFHGDVLLNGMDGLALTTNMVIINALVDTATGGNGGQVTINNAGLLTLDNAASFNLDGSFMQSGGGAISTGADITTTGDDVTFTNEVTVTEDVAINTGAGVGSISFLSRLDASTMLNEGISLTADMGNILFDEVVGATELKELQIVSANNVTANQSITTGTLTQLAGTGTTTFNGAITTSQAAGISLTGTNFTFGDLTGDDSVTTTGNGTVTITQTGLLDIAANADFDLTGAFLQNGGGTVETAGDITTAGNSITFTDSVVLTDNGLVTLDTTNGVAAGAGISFLSTLDGDGDCNDSLTLKAGNMGDILFMGAVGSTEPLGDVTIQNAMNVTIAQSFAVNSLQQIAGTGTTTVNGITTTKSAAGVDLNTNIIDINADVDVTADNAAGISFTSADQTIVNAKLTSIDGSIDINSGDVLAINGSLQTTTGPIDLQAVSNITMSGTTMITSTSGDVAVTADSGNTNNGAVITMTDGSLIDSGTGTITLSADGNVTLGGLKTTNNTANAVAVTSKSAAIVDGGETHTDIEADAVGAGTTLTAVTGIGSAANPLETTISELTATVTGVGEIRLDESTALIINKAMTTDGNINITAVGDLTVDDNGAAGDAVSAGAGGTVDLFTEADLIVRSEVTTNSAAINLLANNDIMFSNQGMDNGNISSTGGTISIEADADSTGGGSITQEDGLSINAGSGEVVIQAQDDITLANVVTTNSGANALSIQSFAGSLLDGGETDVDLIANIDSAVTSIRTATGAGTTANPLETSLVNLDLINATSGEVQLRETDQITIQNLEQSGAGLVDLRSQGSMTIDNAAAGNAVVSNGTGSIHFETIGASADLSVNNGITATTGQIELQANGADSDVNIDSDITATGGNVDVFASRSVSVSTGQTVMTTGSAGNDSGDVSITADTGMIGIDGDITTTSNGTENAGNVLLETNGTGDIAVTGTITAAGAAASNAGNVTVQAADGSVSLNQIDVSAGGAAGTVMVAAGSTGSAADVTLNGTIIATGTTTDGTVNIDAADNIVDGNDGSTLISTGDLSLSAGTNIGEIDDFVARTGNAIDAEVSGLLRDLSIDDAGGEIHLKINGDLQAATGAILPDTDGAATLLLQTTGALDVGTNPGVLDLSAGDQVGLHAGTVLTLPDLGMNVGTGATGGTLRLSGTTDIVDPAGRELGKLSAQDLFVISGSAGGATTLNVDVTNLDADLSTSPAGTTLTINNDGDLNAASIVTNQGDLLINNGGELSVTSISTNDGEVRINNSLATGGDISIDLIDAGTGNVILDTTANGGQLRDLNGAGTNIIGTGLALRTENITGVNVADQTLEVQVDMLAASAVNLGVKIFDETGDLEIGTVDGLNGIAVTAADGDDVIEVVTVGELNINQNVTSDGQADIFLASRGSATGNDINIDAGITKTGTAGDVRVIAGDNVTLTSKSNIGAANDSNITVLAGVDINAPDVTGMFANGNTNADILMSDGSSIRSDEGDVTLQASNDVAISIVGANQDNDSVLGNVLITADENGLGSFVPDGLGEIRETLSQTTATGEAANVTADNATFRAASGIGALDDIETDINSLNATNTTTGDINIFEIVGAGDNGLIVNAVSNMSGSVDLQTGDGNLTIAGPVSTTDNGATPGNVNLIAGDDDLDGNGNLFIQSTITTETGSVTLTSEGNDIQFTDDGDVTTTSGRIDMTAGATDDSGNVTQTAGSVLDAGDDEITIIAHGQITLGQLKTTSNSDQAVTLTADQDIDSADPGNILNIDAAQGRLIIRTESGVEPIETKVDSLDLANLATGSVTINEADALNVIQLDQDANEGIDLTAGGTLTIVAGEPGVTGTDSPVNLTTTGTGSKVVINSTVQSTTGKMTINAADDLSMGANATIETNSDELLIVAGDALNGSSTTDGGILMADGAQIIGNDASIDLVADQQIQVGSITTTTDVRLTSLESSIADAGNSTGHDIAAMNLGLDAATGIGTGDALETSVELLAAKNSTSGAIQIDNTDQALLTIGTFNQSPESPGLGDIVGITNTGATAGDVQVTNVGAITVADVVTNSSGGNIELTATNDGGDNDHLVVNAEISTKGAGGNVTLDGGTDVAINDRVAAQADDVTASPDSLAGDITVIAGRNIQVNAQVDAQASDASSGGDIEFTATTGDIDINSQVNTQSSTTMEGGNVTMNAEGSIDISAQVTASALEQVDPFVPADRTDVPIPNPNTQGHIELNAGAQIIITDSGMGTEFDIDGNTITGSAGNGVTLGPDVIVRSATGAITDPTPSLSNVATPQVTATGIGVITGDFGRALESTFIYEVVWQANSTDTFSSGQVVTYVTPGMADANAPGAAPGSFIFDNMYNGNPDPLNPAAPIPITITLFDDPNITFLAGGNDLGVVSITSEADVPGEGLAGAAVFDVSIDVPPLEAPRTVFTDALETETQEFSDDSTDETIEGVIESEASRDELILIIQKVGPDGKVDKDQFGRPIQRTLYGADAIEWLTDLPELHERLDFGRWKIFTKEGQDGQMMLVEDVVLRDGRPVVGDEGTQDRPPTSEEVPLPMPETEAPEEADDNSTSLNEAVPIIPDEEQGSLKTLGAMALLPLSSAPLNRTLQSLRKVKHLAGILVGFLRSL